MDRLSLIIGIVKDFPFKVLLLLVCKCWNILKMPLLHAQLSGVVFVKDLSKSI